MAASCGRGHIAGCLARIAASRRDLDIAISLPSGHRLKGGEFVDRVRRLAGALAERGVGEGNVVAIAAFNSEHYIELFLAVVYVGAIVAPLNYRWSFEEAKTATELIKPVALAADENCISIASEFQKNGCLPSLSTYILIGSSAPSSTKLSFLEIDFIIENFKGKLPGEPIWAPRDVALICFTSGTTGKPKGVVISHTSLIVQSLAKIAIVGYSEDDVYLHTAPLFHIGGISSFLAIVMAGGCHILMPKFDGTLACDAIKRYQVTAFISVPAILADLIAQMRKENRIYDGGTVKKILNGGGSLSQGLIADAGYLFPHATIFSAYGMTEASSSLTFMTRTRRFVSSDKSQQDGVCVGQAAPHVELRVSADNIESKNAPFTGRILTRGLHVMLGYWTSKEHINSNLKENGWLDTGDYGWIDNSGNLWLLGRENDRIKTGGENVYPEEVEHVLLQHPGVDKAVVIGMPDDRLGEKVAAFVSVKNGWNWTDETTGDLQQDEISPAALQNHCRERNLTRFKVPKNIALCTMPYPMTSSGKIKRQDFKRQVMMVHKQPPCKL